MPWGSFGPAVAAVLLARRAREATALLRGLLRFRARPADYALALLGPLGVVVVATGAELAWQGVGWSGLRLDLLPWTPLFFALILVVGGPLGEEIGWRGYALPRLIAGHGPLRASLALAGLWVIWHLPLFWLEGAAQSGGSLGWFALVVGASAVLFTGFWLRTGGNLWLAVVLHAGINVTTYGAPIIAPALDREDTLFTPVLALSASALALLVAWPWRASTPESPQSRIGNAEDTRP